MTTIAVEVATTAYAFTLKTENYKSVTTREIRGSLVIASSKILIVRSTGTGTLTALLDGVPLTLAIDRLLVIPVNLTDIHLNVDDVTFVTVGN